MNIQIISDIHGNKDSLLDALKCPYPIDAYIFVGDFLYHGPRNQILEQYNPSETSDILNNINKPVIAVRGNCDAEVDQMLLNFPMMSDSQYFHSNQQLIFITHGHLYQPNDDIRERHANIYISGHTHIPVLEKTNFGILFNPGSISLPKENNKPSYGLIHNGQLSLIDLESHTPLQSIKL
ncbi:phosphodiesterase [Erysipelothrix urinaevulpis]|uniref:phosphodiesterase n=1 Tax=Erysipelothrix urinaevulpis TaxID=2683717 RepID=UPI00135AEB09|nr:phosphodiesterase [Erysipelothrix urinaevulpis]